MFEIIPNWHPVFVHFTVALLSLAVVFHFKSENHEHGTHSHAMSSPHNHSHPDE